MFSTAEYYPYSTSDLEFLTDKASIFLLQQFCNIYKNKNTADSTISESPPSKKRRTRKTQTKIKHTSPVLGILDSTSLPTGYSTSFPPSPHGCDHCCKALDRDGTVLICGHGYYWSCYNVMENKSRHC